MVYKIMNVFVRIAALFLLSAAALMTVRESSAQSLLTNPVGYLQASCTASSDTVVAVPFQQPAAYIGTTASVSGSTVTISGTTVWAANQFVYSGSGTSTYYVLMGAAASGTNPKQGCYYTVASNGSNTLTVALNGDNISSVPDGSAVSVIPYCTLGTVFPPANAGTSFIASTTMLTPQGTVLYVPAYSGTGINLSAPSSYFFYQGVWCSTTGSAGVSYSDAILIPDGYVTVRNPGATTVLTTMGNVPMGDLTIPLVTNTTQEQDNFVAIARPVDTSLDNLALSPSAAFTPTTNPLFTQDELLVFSPTQTGINNAPGSGGVYFYYMGTSGTGWRLSGDAITTDHGNDVVPAGTGFVIRKAPTVNAGTALWQNSPTY